MDKLRIIVSSAHYTTKVPRMCVSLLFGAKSKANDRAKNVEINEKAPRTHLLSPGNYRSGDARQPWMARGPSCSKSRPFERR